MMKNNMMVYETFHISNKEVSWYTKSHFSISQTYRDDRSTSFALSTVDRFQGDEADVVIISLVNSFIAFSYTLHLLGKFLFHTHRSLIPNQLLDLSSFKIVWWFFWAEQDLECTFWAILDISRTLMPQFLIGQRHWKPWSREALKYGLFSFCNFSFEISWSRWEWNEKQ